MLVFMAMARPAVRLLKNSAAVILRGFDIPSPSAPRSTRPTNSSSSPQPPGAWAFCPLSGDAHPSRAGIGGCAHPRDYDPRQKIFALPSNLPIEAASAQVIEHMRSRVPVYDETRGPEHIVGVIYSKDLARLIFFRTAAPVVELKLSQVMREVMVVPETKSVLDLIREFQQRRRQMAIVVDEYGSTVGLVTAEDAIEQLTGELEDEFDSPALPVLTTTGGALLMDGVVNLRDLETQTQWSLPRDGGVETLAGFVLMRLGHIPKVGESIIYEGRRLTVVEMDNRRIAKIRVEPAGEKPTTS